MPCYTSQRQSVEFKVEHFDLLEKAINAKGGVVLQRTATALTFRWWIGGRATVENGKIEVQQADRDLIDQLKQAYSREAVKQAASRFGWAVKQKSENQLSIVKR